MDRVKLSGFDLDDIEMQIVTGVIEKSEKRIKERMRFDELNLRLKKRKKGKSYIHEIKGSLKAGKNLFNAEDEDYNLLRALSKTINKLMNEVEHKRR